MLDRSQNIFCYTQLSFPISLPGIAYLCIFHLFFGSPNHFSFNNNRLYTVIVYTESKSIPQQSHQSSAYNYLLGLLCLVKSLPLVDAKLFTSLELFCLLCSLLGWEANFLGLSGEERFFLGLRERSVRSGDASRMCCSHRLLISPTLDGLKSLLCSYGENFIHYNNQVVPINYQFS